MKKRKLLVTAPNAVLLPAFTQQRHFTLWFFFGKRKEEASTVTAEGLPIYECPMHPWITSTNPADNCSICGMKLVRRGDASAAQAALHHGH